MITLRISRKMKIIGWSAISVLFFVCASVYYLNGESRRISELNCQGINIEIITIEPEWLINKFGFFSIFERASSVTIPPDHYSKNLLKSINDLWQLKYLYLNGCPITDEDLIHLGSLAKLRTLGLESSLVTGKTLKFLACKTSLVVLNLSHTQISADGINALKEFQQLDSLYLQGTRFPVGILYALSSLPRLIELDLSETAANDDDVKDFKMLRLLRTLYLDNTLITDKSVDTFLEMNRLEFLSLKGSMISSSALQRLKRIRPEITVLTDNAYHDASRLLKTTK